MSVTTIRGLEVFCAVIEAGGVTAASARLGMSQPAVSQQIAKLEDHFGLTLFVREHGRIRATETALSIYEEASQAFDGLERVLSLARDIRSLDRGTLRIAAPHSASATYLPRAIKMLVADRPNLRVSVQLGTYEKIVGMIAAREVDIGIAKGPILNPGVETIALYTSLLVAAARVDDPIATATRIGARELAREPLIMLGRGRPWRDEIDAQFRAAAVAARVAVETQSVESACAFAAEGFGVAIVPEWLAHGLSRPEVTLVPLELGIRHEFVVAFPVRTRRRDLAADFAKACRLASGKAEGQCDTRGTAKAIPQSKRS
jgi:DNA-binding transcriptional LysR family regulator